MLNNELIIKIVASIFSPVDRLMINQLIFSALVNSAID